MSRKIIYIAGYSRSGSTILDILLGSHPGIFGTGELVYLFGDWVNSARKCTCGKQYEQCDFWKDFKLPGEISFENAIDIIRKVEGRKQVEILEKGKISNGDTEAYALVQNALYNYIFDTSKSNIIVDSSKSSRDMAGRFYALHQYTGFDVYVIHLVKNGLSIVESYVTKGRNWAMEGYGKNDRFLAARSSAGWLLANKIAMKLGAKMPEGRYMRMRYEDLAIDPQKKLQEIGEFVNIDLSELSNQIAAGTAFSVQHNVGGNRLRLENEIKFKISKGLKKIDLSSKDRLVFNLIAGRLNRSFGY